MSASVAERNQLYSVYRAETEANELPRSLRWAALVLFVINTVFVGVDWILFPDRLIDFLPTRLFMDVAVLIVFMFTAHRYPVASSFATVAAGGWMLFTVIHGTGGASSDYYVGLVLLIIGLGVLAPLSVRQSAITISGLFLGYLALPLLDLGGHDSKGFAVSVFFLG